MKDIWQGCVPVSTHQHVTMASLTVVSEIILSHVRVLVPLLQLGISNINGIIYWLNSMMHVLSNPFLIYLIIFQD